MEKPHVRGLWASWWRVRDREFQRKVGYIRLQTSGRDRRTGRQSLAIPSVNSYIHAQFVVEEPHRISDHNTEKPQLSYQHLLLSALRHASPRSFQRHLHRCSNPPLQFPLHHRISGAMVLRRYLTQRLHTASSGGNIRWNWHRVPP